MGLVQLNTKLNPYPDTTHDKRVEKKKNVRRLREKR